MEFISKNNRSFIQRHIGPNAEEVSQMLKTLKISSLEEMIAKTIPSSIRVEKALDLGQPMSEGQVLKRVGELAATNQLFKTYIGTGYSGCITPPVIQRNILENPGWYTQYTPYQAEIAQGRLEALLNFQTMIMDLTGLDLANASMLDEGTAAAEAMTLCRRVSKSGSNVFLVADDCHPQTISVIQTRAEPIGIEVRVQKWQDFDFSTKPFACVVSYPGTYGEVSDFSKLTQEAHAAGALVVACADLLSLVLLKAPGEWGADVAVGNSQRFGVPPGYGGPHAAFMATKSEHKRQIPGRIVGVSKDKTGRPALRLALQTREQHIRRDKASSNICTAQVLLAVMASMYAVYHGPEGLKDIAQRIHSLTASLKEALLALGYHLSNENFFDTLRVQIGSETTTLFKSFDQNKINVRKIDATSIGLSLDETTTLEDLHLLIKIFAEAKGQGAQLSTITTKAQNAKGVIPVGLHRSSAILTHPVFNSFHSESEMLRYVTRLQSRDLSLTTSMIPLGSCTMKLNAAMEMLPISWERWSQLHPFAPVEQAQGYQTLFSELETALSQITGFPAVSLQPNAGSQGEYAGLLAIRKYHHERGQKNRTICLIPQSAHGTNPASAVMAGMKVVVVACDEQGNIDVQDLEKKAKEHSQNLAALMVTYPSTHGVFESQIRQICEIIHTHGGQVYMDGANMNAQVGLSRPADYGADVLHLNLHKTFCIPHGGGGPGMGPIGVQKHLAPYLPSHPVVKMGGEKSLGTISAAPWGSANILLISWAYIKAMSNEGLTKATQVAILNANYMAQRLDPHFPVLYKGDNGFVAHECIVDLRAIKEQTGIDVEDVAKRLMDYGFHAPTVSFPVAGTMMIEPTESESKAELDRFCDAMIAIKKEIDEIASGKADRTNNLLKNAPHTAAVVTADGWNYPYARERAAFPLPYVREHKFWPYVSRIDAAFGDKQLVCSCLPIEAYS
ncbi:MAG: aminomethyl-transferring glycine dehydrogenase [Bdellovibrionales bacterium]